MALLLIRHGETDLNTARVVQFPDTPLGEVGHRQAARLARRLATQRLDLVLTSDYARARMTAAHIAQACGAECREDRDLRERNFGDLRGRPYAELGTLDIFAPDYAPPGGECWADFHARVDRAWQAIETCAAGVGGDVAVVTHGLVLRSLLERRLDASAHVMVEGVVVGNTSVTVVEALPPWRVLELASVTHLEDGANDVAPV